MDSPEVKTKQMCDKLVKVRQVTPDRKQTYRHMLPRTVCHGLVVLTLGMTLSIRGPSFIDLQLISGTDVEKGSFYFTASAFGYIIGSLVLGVIYARIKVKDMFIIVPMIISAITFTAIPWCSHFVAMLTIHAVTAFFNAFQETTVNTEEVVRWEGNSYSAMQFLSFCYSLGGIIGPLLVEPFLAPKTIDLSSNISTGHYVTSFQYLYTPQTDSAAANVSHDMYAALNGSHDMYAAANGSHDMYAAVNGSHDLHNKTYSLFKTDLLLQDLGRKNESINSLNFVNQIKSYFIKSSNSSLESNFSQTLLPSQSNIHYGYLIGGIVIIISCLPLCVLHLRTRTKHQKKEHSVVSDEDLHGKLPFKMYFILAGMISMFYFFYTTIDDPYSMYLSVFVVSHLDWSKNDGALVSSLYWGCSTVAKLAMILLVRYVNPSLLLFSSCLGMLVFMILLTISTHFHVHIMVWVCTAFMAFSQSAVFGGGFAWADANLLKFDGKVASCTMIFASLGAMINPMLLGVTMKEWSPMAFPYLLTFQAAITFVIFLAMLVVFKPYVSRKYGSPRSHHLDKIIIVEDRILFHEKIKDEKISTKFV